MEAPFRSFSSALLALVALSITRVALGPLTALNRALHIEDHMYFRCLRLLRRMELVPGMAPYLAAAHAAAERCAEQQALALSQQAALSQQSGHSGFRASVGLGTLVRLDPPASTLFTFTAGVLPANLNVDPVTHLWKLFQQGAPLCLVFNSLQPSRALEAPQGSDLRSCKKAVYDFLLAAKQHLGVDDDALFTISNVFSDSTHDLLRVAGAVEALMPGPADVAVEKDKLKVFMELLQTERKYISDLELLLAYKTEVLAAELLLSEQTHVLFPNLNDIVDFHRRLLNGLECNMHVPPAYQRIGLVFLHAAGGPFKAYEPWTVGQIAAVELIAKEAANLKRLLLLLDPGFELQLYIIKPIQRICKYPLLLKELVKHHNQPELVAAEAAMREVAAQVNEAQRRAENVGYLQNLVARVRNWRGFNLRDQGELLYHLTVAVRDGDAEKEYVAYLFENIIFFFVEAGDKKDKKMRELLGRKKLALQLSLLETLSRERDGAPLELKGRVYISEIYNISLANAGGHTLVISWLGKKESGLFTLRYRTEEPRNQWEQCLRALKTSEMGLEPLTRHNSLLSTFSMLKAQKTRLDSSALTDVPARVTYKGRESLLQLPSHVLFGEVVLRLQAHLAAHGDDAAVGKLKYRDEDGDFVVMDLNDDWVLAVDMLEETQGELHIWVG